MDYYVELLEKIENKNGSSSYRGWLLSESSALDLDDAKTKINNKSDVVDITNANKNTIKTKASAASCHSILNVYSE